MDAFPYAYTPEQETPGVPLDTYKEGRMEQEGPLQEQPARAMQVVTEAVLATYWVIIPRSRKALH